jgi:lysophospholipase L1-like esterase
VSIGRRGAWATLATASRRSPVGKAASKLHLYFHRGAKRGDLTVRLDGKPHATIQTSVGEPGDAMATVPFEDGPHRIALRVSSPNRVRLFGAALERDGPGFVYDSFGILGALSRRFSRVDPDHWRRQLALRGHDLLMIQFGGNSIQDGALNYTRYRRQFRALLRLFRQGSPDASCLVLSPHDHGRRRRRNLIDTDPKLLRLIPVQREVALEEGCAWLSVFEAMGGEGSMGRYHREGKAYSDLRHLRHRGAKAIADHLVDALEEGFSGYLDGLGCPSRERKPGEPLSVDRFAG